MRKIFPLITTLILAAVALAQDTKPPIVTYGTKRTSEKWIDLKKGSVAVDRGATWNGVTVYLSLTSDLIAVDPKTEKPLWSRDVSAYWTTLTFAEIETKPGEKTWTVELRPTNGADANRERYRLSNGEPIATKPATPPGKKLDPFVSWAGDKSDDPRRLTTLIDSAADFETAVVAPFFAKAKEKPDFSTIDWKSSIVLVVFFGETTNCRGIDADAWEDDTQIVVRLRPRSFQTASFGGNGGGVTLRPWGVFVLPRHDPMKPIVVERNKQGLIGGPALWVESRRFTKVPHPPEAPESAKQK